MYIIKKHEKVTIRIFVNKMIKRITFKIKDKYYLEHLTPERMEVLGSTEGKITKNKNCENVPNLEIAEVLLVHCDIVNNDC